MTKQTTSAGTATDQQLAFGSNTDPARRKHFWVDELGTIRTDRLWVLVESITKLRAELSKRMEDMFHRTRALDARVAALEETLGPSLVKKKP